MANKATGAGIGSGNLSSTKKGRPAKPKEIEADSVDQAGKEIVKSKRRTPANLEGGSSAKKEDVSRILANCLKWYNLPQVKTLQELEQRIGEFFVTCISTGEIPTVEKLCLAIGYDRRTVWTWESGEATSTLGAGAMDIIKKAKNFLATFESEMVTEGKINPVVYIFRAKNFFGMKDVQDYILTPNNPMGADSDPATLAQKYQNSLPGVTIEPEKEED